MGLKSLKRLKNMRHEQFITELFRTDYNAAEAYRRVYPSVRPDVARICASKLLSSANVKRRLEQRQMAALRRQDITVDRILNEYEEARTLAIAQAKPEAMMAASEKKAKLVGLLVDRRENGVAGEFDNLQSPEEVIALLSEQAGPAVAEQVAKAMGLMPDSPNGALAEDIYGHIPKLSELDTEGNA